MKIIDLKWAKVDWRRFDVGAWLCHNVREMAAENRRNPTESACVPSMRQSVERGLLHILANPSALIVALNTRTGSAPVDYPSVGLVVISDGNKVLNNHKSNRWLMNWCSAAILINSNTLYCIIYWKTNRRNHMEILIVVAYIVLCWWLGWWITGVIISSFNDLFK